MWPYIMVISFRTKPFGHSLFNYLQSRNKNTWSKEDDTLNNLSAKLKLKQNAGVLPAVISEWELKVLPFLVLH